MRKFLAIVIVICSAVFAVGANGQLHGRMMDHGQMAAGCQGAACAATHGIPTSPVDCIAHCIGVTTTSVPLETSTLFFGIFQAAAVVLLIRAVIAIFSFARVSSFAIQRQHQRRLLAGVIMMN